MHDKPLPGCLAIDYTRLTPQERRTRIHALRGALERERMLFAALQAERARIPQTYIYRVACRNTFRRNSLSDLPDTLSSEGE